MILLVGTSGPSPGLPAPYWLITVLHWVTFTLHLTAMNLLFGGLLILLVFGRSPFRRLMFDSEAKLFPTLMAATITLGVAPLLFLQAVYGRFFYSASIVSAWNWFLLIPELIVTYYLFYLVAMKPTLSTKIRLIMLWLAAAGLVYISYTLTMISDLAERPYLWAGMYLASPAGTGVNPAFLQTFFRWAHSITGAVTVAGVGIMLFAVYHRPVRGNADLLRFGQRVFLIGAIHAVVLAVVYLIVIDGGILSAFLRSPGLHAIVRAIVLNIAAAVVLHKATRASRPNGLVISGGLLVLMGIFMMVVARHYLRLCYLQGRFDPGGFPVAAQWSPLVMFAATVVVGLIVLIWMLRIYFAKSNAD